MQPSDPDAVKQFLIATPAFAGLEDPALSRVLGMLTEQKLPAGTIVYREGDAGREIYVLRSGDVEAYKMSRSGRQVLISRLGVGDVFGDMTLIDMQPRSATVRASADSTAYVLTNKDLYTLYREDLRTYVIIVQNITRELCRRLRRSDARLCELIDEVDDLKDSMPRA